jgi:hypothetical protein
MKTLYRDIISAVLAIAGGVIVFAKLNSYDWWLLGSWRGALGVIAVLGLGALLTNIAEVVKMVDGAAATEFVAWSFAAVVTITNLVAATTKAGLIWSSALIGLAWLTQITRHVWRATHHKGHHYFAAT